MGAPHGFDLHAELDGVREWHHRGNGLTLLCCPTPVAPVVSFGVVYLVGSRNEGGGQTGATHILEHLMFKGSRRFNRERGTDIARTLQRVGASFNATTWLDRTNYFEILPAEHLSLAVEIEADRMRHALVRDEDLARERTVVLNELERGENDPLDVLMKASFAHSFVEHPYHHPTIGWRGDVESISGEVLRGFYDTFYHPDNAAVVVVGDVDEGTALRLVEEGFGAIPSAPAAVPQVRVSEPEQRGERRFAVHRAAELGSMILSWRIPEGLHPDLPPLSVLAQVLAEGVTSRLHQKLVETNLCLGVHAYAFELHDPGVLQVITTLSPGVEHAGVEEIIRDEVAELQRSGAQGDEVERARIQVRTDLAFQRESPAKILSGLTEAVAMGDWRRFAHEMELVAQVSIDDLSRVASTHLHERRLTVGWFVPEGGSTRGLARAQPPRGVCNLHRPFAERVELRELPGGARLAVLANPHAPTVTIGGTLRAGVACAPQGRLTVPTVTAAMLERGTVVRSRIELARELEDHGLQLGMETSGSVPSSVICTAQGLAEQLPRLAALVVEVMRSPTFPEEELGKLREQLLGGLARERQETFARAFAAFTRHVYPPGYPHHRRPIEVREAELKALTRDDLEAFHGAAYGPASLILGVIGDVDADEVCRLLTGLIGDWRGGLGELPPWPALGPGGPAEEYIAIADRPNLDVVLGHSSTLLIGDDDFPAAVLANSCLGQSTLTSRLGMAVRDGAGLSYGVYSRFFGTMHLPGPWATVLTVAPDNLQRAVELCRRVVADYVAEGPGEDELADERQALAGAHTVRLATNAGVARELITALTAGLEVSYLDTHAATLLDTTRDQVVDALHRHIHPERLVVTAAGSLKEWGES